MGVAHLHVDDLIALANRVGFNITRTDDKALCRVYVWATDDGHVLYIGIVNGQTSSRVGRLLHEMNGVDDNPNERETVDGAFDYFMYRHNAIPHLFQVELSTNGDGDVERDGKGGPFVAYDPDRTAGLYRRNWLPDAISNRVIRDAQESGWKIPDIEMLLIRICMRLGVPLANDSGTTLWGDSPRLNTAADVLAALLSDDIAACSQHPNATVPDPNGIRACALPGHTDITPRRL